MTSKVLVIRKEQVKVQPVKLFQDMFKMNVNFTELRKGVLFGDYLIVNVKPLM
jgi:hypothetical protein